jgi:hypothetical protein
MAVPLLNCDAKFPDAIASVADEKLDFEKSKVSRLSQFIT